MLELVRITDFVLIESSEIPFKSGLNMISGETGAGKSILLDAISLLLGGRASTDVIRAGAEEAIVEGLFDLEGLPWIAERLQSRGFITPDAEGPQLLVRRTVNRKGKHRIYINGQIATASILQEVCEGLVDLCGQHEHQSLLRPQTQARLLDQYGSLTGLFDTYQTDWETYRALQQERTTLAASEEERARKLAFLEFQVGELEAANLQPDEDVELGREKQLLLSAEARRSLAMQFQEALSGDAGDHGGASGVLRASLQKLKGLQNLDPETATSWRSAVERALAEIEEAAQLSDRYIHSMELHPDRLSAVQERLSLIADFRRKYGATIEAMLETFARLQGELQEISSRDVRLTELKDLIDDAENKLRKTAKSLSTKRARFARVLEDSVTAELQELRMAGAKFRVELTSSDELTNWTALGADQIQYLIQSNKGEAEKPLGKIASGGELSRIMLAIRRVIADKGGIGVYLFDEIDAGIGGQTAFTVGKKLSSVASHNQVICITHLPQIAAFADHHLRVEKSEEKNRVTTRIVPLSSKGRKEELARMLGGDQITKKALENASELLMQAGH